MSSSAAVLYSEGKAIVVYYDNDIVITTPLSNLSKIEKHKGYDIVHFSGQNSDGRFVIGHDETACEIVREYFEEREKE